MKEIQLRAWDKVNHHMSVLTVRVADGKWLVSPGNLFIDQQFAGEVMQYTGLKDKNGVEIYEGDVVKQELPNEIDAEASGHVITKVEYDQGECKFGLDDGGDGYWTLYDDLTHNYQVIGNIYANPELLEARNG